jgi:hypothetical protein
MKDSEFIDKIKSEIKEYEQSGLTNDYDQFAVWFLEKILKEEPGKSIEEYHLGGGGDNKADIGICDEDHELIIIGQVKYARDPLNQSYNDDLIDEVLTARERLENKKKGNEKWKVFKGKYADREKNKPIVLYSIGFGEFNEEAQIKARKEDVKIFDFATIKSYYIKNWLSDKKTCDKITLTLDKGSSIIKTDLPDLGVTNYIFKGKCEEISKNIDEWSDSLFIENLRYRLAGASKELIGYQIEQTLKEEPSNQMLFLNNGLTMSGTRVAVESEKITIFDPQIVNGCQTSWSIFSAYTDMKEEKNKNKNEVLIKLVETQNEKIIAKLTETTNKQNPITSRDLHSNDEVQISIEKQFAEHINGKKIFYDHKEGHWNEKKRLNDIHTYHTGNNQYRIVNNKHCGQIYLCLLGKHHLAKTFKKAIFGEDEYYKTIFNVDLKKEKRFSSNKLSLVPEDVTLETGVEPFVDDVLFGDAIYKFADICKDFYKEKLNSYPVPVPKNIEVTYNGLLESYNFYTTWHFLLIAVICEVINIWVRVFKKDIGDIRKILVGEDKDINLFFKKTQLKEKFKLNDNLEFYDVYDIDKCDESFQLFCRWSDSIAKEIADMIKKERKKPSFSLKHFIDTKPETFSNIKKWLEEIKSQGLEPWASKFPIKLK